MTADELLSPGEVARIFGVNSKTVSRWVKRGQLPAIRTPGGHHRFRRSDVDVFLGAPAPTAPEEG